MVISDLEACVHSLELTALGGATVGPEFGMSQNDFLDYAILAERLKGHSVHLIELNAEERRVLSCALLFTSMVAESAKPERIDVKEKMDRLLVQYGRTTG